MFNFLQQLCCYSKREKPEKLNPPIKQPVQTMSIQPVKVEEEPLQHSRLPETDSIFQYDDEYYLSNHEYQSTSPPSNLEAVHDSDIIFMPYSQENRGEMEFESNHDSSSGIRQKKIQKTASEGQKKKRVLKLWDESEDAQLKSLYEKYKGKWNEIAKHLPGRSVSQCCSRWRRTQPVKVYKRKQWTVQEDIKILELVKEHGKNWKIIASHFPGVRSKQVRERYINKIDPEIDNKPWTEEEDQMILDCFKKYGCKWSQISQHFKGRPENMIKNRFYCYIRRVHLGIQNPYQKRHDELEGIDSSIFHSNDEQEREQEKDEQLFY